jgi:hypothetical protein
MIQTVKSKEMGWTKHCNSNGAKENAYKFWHKNVTERVLLGKSMSEQNDYISTYLQETGHGNMKCIHLG